MAKKAAVQVQEQASPKVFVARTGEVCELDFTKGMTLGDAIRNAGYRFDNVTDVRVNNKKMKNMETELKKGDQITLLGKIAGA